jgi:hypothetical protein
MRMPLELGLDLNINQLLRDGRAKAATSIGHECNSAFQVRHG